VAIFEMLTLRIKHPNNNLMVWQCQCQYKEQVTASYITAGMLSANYSWWSGVTDIWVVSRESLHSIIVWENRYQTV